jgi:hypothetical protein
MTISTLGELHALILKNVQTHPRDLLLVMSRKTSRKLVKSEMVVFRILPNENLRDELLGVGIVYDNKLPLNEVQLYQVVS